MVRVRFAADQNDQFTLSMTKGLARDRACIRPIVARALARARFESNRPGFGTMRLEASLGTPPPLFTDAMIERWRRAVDTKRAKDRGVLAATLPPSVEVMKSGCLRIPGTRAFQDAVGAWIRALPGRIAPLWQSIHDSKGPRPFAIVGDRYITYTNIGDWRTSAKSGGELCLERVDEARVDWQSRVDTWGRCWVGDLFETLRSPRWAFPSDRYQAIAVGEQQACALTESGRVVCCGALGNVTLIGPAASTDPTGMFIGVDADTYGACAWTTTAEGTCWGRAGEPPSGPYAKLATSMMNACALSPSGKVHCSRPQRFATQLPVTLASSAPFVDLSVAQDYVCGRTADDTFLCSDGWAGVARAFDSFMSDTCIVRPDGEVLCKIDRPNIDVPLVTIDIGSQNGCGLDAAGAIHCWGGIEDVPAGPHVAVSVGGKQACAIDTRGAITCFGDVFPGAQSRGE